MTIKKEKENEREALVAKNCPPNSTFAIQDTRSSASEPRALQNLSRELEKFHGGYHTIVRRPSRSTRHFRFFGL
jgi:hypothetical protein